MLSVTAASCVLRFSFAKDFHEAMAYLWGNISLSMLRLGDAL